ncbi:MAG TPA: LemA family protein [Beijerinckiaceae bacterium]|nr:LemA family protein [Beijerinckiaceae bacterium]
MELLWIVGLAAAGIGGGTWYSHNRLVALDSRCERALADIDVQLKHRHSLLPNLFETVKAFTAHERGTIEAVVTARAAALRATSPEAQLQAEAALGHGIAQLFTIAENYPELQASEHFRDLRRELADTENKLAATRRFLNAAVNEYNSTLRQFPANVIAGAARLHKRAFYDIGIERVLIDDAPVFKH